MKRKPKLTKRERKAQTPPRPAKANAGHGHIHCIACGKHLDPSDFEPPAVATTITCDHGSNFATCVTHVKEASALVAEHDRTNQPIRAAQAWH